MLFGRTVEECEGRKCIYTASEIASQPEQWKNTAQIVTLRQKEIREFMEPLLEKGNRRIILCGAGSSAFVGESMQFMMGREFNIHAESIHTTDIVSAPEGVLFDVPTLMVSYARSGESPESKAAIELANQFIRDIYHIIIVCDGQSTLANYGAGKENCLVLVMPEGTCDKGFAMTSSVSCMSIATWCVFNYNKIDDLYNRISKIADSVEENMGYYSDKAKAAAKLDFDRLIWLGSGALKGLAREASIKSMELTDGYIAANYDAPTGFRHGPKTVVNDKTLTIHFISNIEYHRLYDMDFLKEILAEKDKNMVISVAPANAWKEYDKTDLSVQYEISDEWKDSELESYLNCLVFAQLFSLEKSLELGYATDSPSQKGDVNRIVKGVTIYPFVQAM